MLIRPRVILAGRKAAGPLHAASLALERPAPMITYVTAEPVLAAPAPPQRPSLAPPPRARAPSRPPRARARLKAKPHTVHGAAAVDGLPPAAAETGVAFSFLLPLVAVSAALALSAIKRPWPPVLPGPSPAPTDAIMAALSPPRLGAPAMRVVALARPVPRRPADASRLQIPDEARHRPPTESEGPKRATRPI